MKTASGTAWAVVLALTLAGCIGSDEAGGADEDVAGFPASPDGTLRFIVMGDSGTGDDVQYKVAQTMYDVCVERGCDLVLGNGDNIYNDGARHAYDPQFEEKFERPYEIFPDIPFYMVLGNHDNGNGAGSNPDTGANEVQYHYRTDRMSEKWQMPDRWYTWTELDGMVQFFALDSGPQEVSQTPIWLPGTLGVDQEAWLEEEMGKSTAPWKFAFAHHPYASNGQHGSAGIYDGAAGRGLAYKQMLQDHICGNAQAMFAGHDHDLQWHGEQLDCPVTEHIVSGAAAKERSAGTRPTAQNTLFEQYETHGFMWAEVTADAFQGIFFDAEGEILFEGSLEP